MKVYSVDAEMRALLTICDSDLEVRNFVLARITEKHFAYNDCLLIWHRIHAQAKSGDPIPSSETLSIDPVLPETAQVLLQTKDQGYAKTEEDAHALIEQLEQYRKLRTMYDGMRMTLKQFKDDDDLHQNVDKMILDLDNMMMDVKSNAYNTNQIYYTGERDNSREIIKRIVTNEPPQKIKTGIEQFDSQAGGFSRKNVVTIAATTGGGKSVLAIQFCVNMVKLGHNVHLVGFEMDEDEYFGRMLSCVSQLPHHNIDMHTLSPKQMGTALKRWDDFSEEAKANGVSHGLLCPVQEMTPMNIDYFTRSDKLDVLIVDYIGLVGGHEKKQGWERLAEITREFKIVANQRNCVVILLAQLDEDTHTVKYSKAIRHYSSFVWQWAYDRGIAIARKEAGLPYILDITQSKVRNSPSFNFKLVADYEFMTLRDPTPQELGDAEELPAEKDKSQKSSTKTKDSDAISLKNVTSYKGKKSSGYGKPKKPPVKGLRGLQEDEDLSGDAI